MQKMNEILVDEAKEHVIGVLDRKLPDGFYYHNSWHTLDVLKHAELIGNHVRLDPFSMELLKLAALFHDVGYVDAYAGHESFSVEYATDFLREKKAGQDAIRQVVNAINATRVPQRPADIISAILCDADLFYLSDTKDYFRQAELLRREWAVRNILQLDQEAFHNRSLEFFSSHTYHTGYGKKVLQPGKEKVAGLIRNKVSVVKPNDINLMPE